jgi:hypothetical protein
LSNSLAFNFSHVFDAVVWNIKVAGESNIMIIEVRDHERRVVRFSALDYQRGEFLWKDKTMDESWWITLSGASADIAIFTIYADTNNPDKKAIAAYSISDAKVVWWHNDFSFGSISKKYVVGNAQKFGNRELILDLHTGNAYEGDRTEENEKQNVIHPQHYAADHPYFNTVKSFLNQKFNLSPSAALEYLEYDSLIFISWYLRDTELANYLFVISSKGDLVLREKLGEHLKGIGLDTFFILSGCVFFVRNKGELVSYKIL